MAAPARGGVSPHKLVEFLEAAYDFELDDQAWLTAVMRAALATFDGTAMHGAIYDASDSSAFRLPNVHVEGFSDAGVDQIMKAMLGLWRGDKSAPPAADMTVYRRMAHHLATAYRCRRRLQEAQAGRQTLDVTENASEVAGLAALSHRERQTVAYAAIGQSAKETAYALGISDSTVRVLLSRAVRKLGVETRAQLLAHPELQPLVPNAGEARRADGPVSPSRRR